MRLSFYIWIYFILFEPTGAFAQLIPLGDLEHDSLSTQGFEQLKATIGDARIVILGEQEHGIGTEYKNLATLVQFLHEEMDFNVLADEFCFFSINHVKNHPDSVKFSAQFFRECMYWPQGKAQEYNLLLDYIDKQEGTSNPIHYEGFDSRIFLRHSFYTTIESYFSSRQYHISESKKERFLIILDHVLHLEYKDSTNMKEQSFFLKQTDALIAQMKKHQMPERDIQQMQNLKGFVLNAWDNKQYNLSRPQRFLERERQMAENLFWLIDEIYPNEKIIIRTHNGHAARNTKVLKGILPDTLINDMITLGDLISQRYKEKCHIIGTTFYAGNYCKWDYVPKTIPLPHHKSLEAHIHETGYSYAYVNLDSLKDTSFYLFFNDFNTWIESGQILAPFGEIYDGIIFIDQATVPTEISKEK